MIDPSLYEQIKVRLASHDKAVEDVKRLELLLIEAFKEIRLLQDNVTRIEFSTKKL